MIVPTMTLDEVVNQFKGDYTDILTKRRFFQPKFETLVKRSNRFPVHAEYEYISHTNHNRYIYFYSAAKRGEWNKPHCHVAGVYERPEGKYAVFSSFGGRTFLIFPPHFFVRYRERILKDDNIFGDELIKRFFRANSMFAKEPITEQHTKAYKKYESEDGAFQAARCAEGNIFLEIQSSSVIIMKTIISDEMLFDDQKEAFTRMNKILDENKDLRVWASPYEDKLPF